MEDLSLVSTFPYFHNFTASTNSTKILLPDSAKVVTAGSEDEALYISQAGSTEGSAPPSNKGFIPKANYMPIKMGRGNLRQNDIYVAAKTGTPDVSIILEAE